MDYSKNLIKKYKYWELYIHTNQSYLGRCIVWCKRNDAEDLPDATEEEQKELFVILGEVEGVINKTFHPGILNYAFLGNSTHHLHGHIIPRYSKDQEFDGVIFTDERWGHNYKTNHDFKISDGTFGKILGLLKSGFN